MALTMRAFPEAGSDQRANGGGLVGAAIFEEMGRCLTGTTGDWNKEEADQIRTQTTTCAAAWREPSSDRPTVTLPTPNCHCATRSDRREHNPEAQRRSCPKRHQASTLPAMNRAKPTS
jgi:hypothetical protein